jgi:hypothetical protein
MCRNGKERSGNVRYEEEECLRKSWKSVTWWRLKQENGNI